MARCGSPSSRLSAGTGCSGAPNSHVGVRSRRIIPKSGPQVGPYTHRSTDTLPGVNDESRFLHIEMDITSKCNIRYRMCYFSFDRYFHGKAVHFPVAQFEQMARDVFPLVKTLTLSLGSEPLASPHFTTFLKMASVSGVPDITFYTNGLLMTPAVVEAMLTADVAHVTVSVDGATPGTYASIRTGGELNKVLTNVRHLVARRTALGRARPVVRFGVVMMKSNAHEWADIVSLASECGVEEMTMFHMVVYEGLETAGESLVHHPELSNRSLDAALVRANECGVHVVSHPARFGAPAEPTPQVAATFEQTPYCRYPFFHISMNAGGHVLACPFSHGEAPFGTVSDTQSLLGIWTGPAFTELRRRILAHDPPPMCLKCSYLASQYPNHTSLFAPRVAG